MSEFFNNKVLLILVILSMTSFTILGKTETQESSDNSDSVLMLSLLCPIVKCEKSSDELSRFWHNACENINFEDTINIFAIGPQRVWPPIHSSKYSETLQKKDRIQQSEFHELAKTLVRDLRTFESTLKNISNQKFTQKIENLLQMRDQVINNQSYINLIISDEINRIVFVNVGERLIESESLTTDLIDNVMHLSQYRPDMIKFGKIVEIELSIKLPGYDNCKNDVERVNLLWKILEPDTRPMFPNNILDIEISRILETQRVLVLLTRMLTTDCYSRTCLPAFVMYRKNAPSYSSTDDYQEVVFILGENAKANYSLGAKMNGGLNRTASAASQLLSSYRIGKLRRQLHIGTPKNPIKPIPDSNSEN